MRYKDLQPTCDPSCFIEEIREGYVRYQSTDGRRWEVHGICTGIGKCWEGAVGPAPELDCPVAPGFSDNCCPLRIKVLEKVIVPALSIDNIASKALEAHNIIHETVLMVNDYSYGELMNKLWKAKEPFIIVEHDIVVFPEAIDNLINCSESYCGYYYNLGGNLGGTLGCTKFGEEILKMEIDFTGIKWDHIDGKIASEIGKEDFHRHYPSVTHLHGNYTLST